MTKTVRLNQKNKNKFSLSSLWRIVIWIAWIIRTWHTFGHLMTTLNRGNSITIKLGTSGFGAASDAITLIFDAYIMNDPQLFCWGLIHSTYVFIPPLFIKNLWNSWIFIIFAMLDTSFQILSSIKHIKTFNRTPIQVMFMWLTMCTLWTWQQTDPNIKA